MKVRYTPRVITTTFEYTVVDPIINLHDSYSLQKFNGEISDRRLPSYTYDQFASGKNTTVQHPGGGTWTLVPDTHTDNPKTIDISMTYQQTTYESREDGDYSNQGHRYYKKSVTLDELIELMRERNAPSSSHIFSSEYTPYFSSRWYALDYDVDESTSIHFHLSNPDWKRWLWLLAAKMAGHNIIFQ